MKSASTCRASVGDTAPEGFALGAETGRPNASSTRRATGWAGILIAMLSCPPAASAGTVAARGSTIVTGPGQQVWAIRSAASFQALVRLRATSSPLTWAIRGLSAGRDFARYTAAIASASKVEAASP